MRGAPQAKERYYCQFGWVFLILEVISANHIKGNDDASWNLVASTAFRRAYGLRL